MIRAVDYKKTAKTFKECFDLNLNEYLDSLLTTEHCTSLDYEKFEQKMFERHSETRNDGVSLQEVINSHYGVKGVELIKSIL